MTVVICEDAMDIVRIDSYEDSRLSKNVLCQHGAYLVDNEPYQIEIVVLDKYFLAKALYY